nr:plasmid mobilization relaxosome protein MobC [uncultured Tyzzerella sp.]
MKNRKRNIKIELYVTEYEKKLIYQKMKELPTTNFSSYARKMLIDGKIISINSSSELKQLIYEINKIGVNINQLTKVANETKNVNKSMIQNIVIMQEELQKIVMEKVERLFGNN